MFTQVDSLSTDTDAVDSDGPYHLKLSSVIGRFKTPTIRSFIYLCLALKKWKQLQYIKNSKQHFYMINIIICDESFKYGPSTWLSPEFLASRWDLTLHTLKMHWGTIYDARVNTALLLTKSTTTNRAVNCRQLRKPWNQTTGFIVFVLNAYATWTFYFLINLYYKTWNFVIIVLVLE